MHTAEIKLRLTPADAALLKAMAARGGEPPAVLARRMVRAELDAAIEAAARNNAVQVGAVGSPAAAL